MKILPPLKGRTKWDRPTANCKDVTPEPERSRMKERQKQWWADYKAMDMKRRARQDIERDTKYIIEKSKLVSE